MGCDGIVGMERGGEGVIWDAMVCDGIRWGAMEWDGIGRDGITPYYDLQLRRYLDNTFNARWEASIY